MDDKTQENIYVETNVTKHKMESIDLDKQIENLLAEMEYIQEKWQIEIPAINLNAPIAKGTSQEVMLEYVGHFDNTNLWKGNIGLAAHNRRFSNKLF